MLTYQLLPQLPVPPQTILNSINFNLENPDHADFGLYRRRNLTNWQGHNFSAAMNARIKFTDQFEQWVKLNIVSEYNDAGINYVDSNPDRHSTGAHCDQSRRFALIYNVRAGGPNAALCFWQEQGYPLIRISGSQCTDQSRLTLIDRVTGPTGHWYILDGHVLHSVEELSEQRINLQINLDHNPYAHA